jgi:phage shock protein A
MNAEELTKKYNEQRVKVDQLTKTVEYLEQELSKLRMIVDDMKIDFQMEKARVQK